jgi:hypothetical protein
MRVSQKIVKMVESYIHLPRKGYIYY